MSLLSEERIHEQADLNQACAGSRFVLPGTDAMAGKFLKLSLHNFAHGVVSQSCSGSEIMSSPMFAFEFRSLMLLLLVFNTVEAGVFASENQLSDYERFDRTLIADNSLDQVYAALKSLEKAQFATTYDGDTVIFRLERLEKKVFGKVKSGTPIQRLDMLSLNNMNPTSAKVPPKPASAMPRSANDHVVRKENSKKDRGTSSEQKNPGLKGEKSGAKLSYKALTGKLAKSIEGREQIVGLRNLSNQFKSTWVPRGSPDWPAAIAFFLKKDGGINNPQISESSGSADFDQSALEALVALKKTDLPEGVVNDDNGAYLIAAFDYESKEVEIGDPNISYSGYLTEIQRTIKRNWHPPKVDTSKKVAVQYEILKNGTIINVKVIKSSGNDLCDAAGLKALRDSSPLPPLPFLAPNSIVMQFTFDYNVHK